MHQVLVYADSLSWGIVPGTRERFAFSDRWPGVMEHGLLDQGFNVRVIEDCLNGRRTVLEDPFKPGRNGLKGLEQRMEIHAPLALVMIFLGTNDFQSMHSFRAWDSAQGIRALVGAIHRAPIEPGMPTPKILLIAPPAIQKAIGSARAKFLDAEHKAVGLGDAIQQVAIETDCEFFDASEVTPTSAVDGVHLDRNQHHLLGNALAEKVAMLLPAEAD